VGIVVPKCWRNIPVTHARRQYDAVDPTNRLVAAQLERRWNDALSTQTALEGELLMLQQGREHPLTDAAKRDLLAVARDVRQLWDHPHSSPEFKKRVLRIVLNEIIVTSEEDRIRFVLHWQGGDHTQLEFPKLRTGQHRYVTDAEIVEIVHTLARVEPDARIASILNKNQRRTPHGQSWTARRVCSLRNHHGIAVYHEGERQARAEMSVREVARTLGVTPSTVLRLIREHHLPATQACPSAPWILRTEDVGHFVTTRRDRATPPTADSAQLTLEIP
jgi:transposase-like protein